MGKTHEALARAEKEYGESIQKSEVRQIQGPPPRRAACRNDWDCYQKLKANLLVRYPDAALKSIVFAGLREGDGASTTAVNFASAMARDCGLKVLLVDANMRTPSLHETFKIDRSPGLSDLLRNDRDMLPKVVNTGPRSPYVLPCGRHISGPGAVFESPRFAEFLKKGTQRFDYVILDAPPALKYSETSIIGAKADGVILVLSAGTTRERVAVRAKRELQETGAKIVGMVLNRRKFHIPDWLYARL
jgi:protein-tyrosine kinase